MHRSTSTTLGLLTLLLALFPHALAAQTPRIMAGGKQMPGFPALAVASDGNAASLRWKADADDTPSESTVVRWGHPAILPSEEVLLLKSGRLRVDTLSITKDHLQIGDASGLDQLPWKTTSLSRTAVRGILFQPSGNRREQFRLLTEIASQDRPQDILLLKNGSRLSGTLLSKSPASDAPGGDSVFQLALKADEKPLSIPADRVVAWLASGNSETTPADSAALGWLGFADGSLLHVQSAETFPKRSGKDVPWQGLRLHLTDNSTLLFTFERPLATHQSLESELVYAEPHLSSVKRLGPSLIPQYKYIPWLSTSAGADKTWPYVWNAGLLGDELSVKKKLYRIGLAMHSASRTIFEVEPGHKQFVTELGIEDSAASQGSVAGQILLQRPTGKWETVSRPVVVRQGEAPQQIVVPLGDAVRITLVIDFADQGDIGDHAVWLDPRFEK